MFVYHGGRQGRNSDTSKFKEEHFVQPYFIRLRMLFTISSIGVYCGNGSARHFRRTGVGWTPWELRCMQALSVGNVRRQHRGVMHLPCSPFRVPCCCSSSCPPPPTPKGKMRHPFLGISRRKKDEKIFFLVGGGTWDHVLHNGYQFRRLVGHGLLVGFTTLVSVSVSVSLSLSLSLSLAP